MSMWIMDGSGYRWSGEEVAAFLGVSVPRLIAELHADINEVLLPPRAPGLRVFADGWS